MPSSIPQAPVLKLAICIATFNRGSFIAATLDSILVQATDLCEVVVLDGASTDCTEHVVSEYSRRFPQLRYIRQNTNNGIDRDYDRAVELANAEYCWLMTDDDLLLPGAVAAVMESLRREVSLIFVNTETRDFEMSRVLQERWIPLESDRIYGPKEIDRVFEELGDALRFIGAVVIRREIWLTRNKERYYGSLFVHLGVIFQEPLPGETLLIARPCISYRMGNSHTFSSKMFETFMIRWPSVVWSLPLSESTKSKVCDAMPWRSFKELLFWRAIGFYSLHEYRSWIRPRLHSTRETMPPVLAALLPGVLINTYFVLYYSLTRRSFRAWPAHVVLQLLGESRFRL